MNPAAPRSMNLQLLLVALFLFIPSFLQAKTLKFQFTSNSQILSQDGKIIGLASTGDNRIVLPLNKISKNLIKAVVVTEDRDFYRHGGYSLKGMMRALLTDISHRSAKEGGSTITQQLARNLFLSQARTVNRKIEELRIATELEKRYSKDEIMEMYLNYIYFGRGCYGAETASLYYFGKHASQLRKDEAAMLAQLIKGPELFNPVAHPERARKEQLRILNNMRAEGVLSAKELDYYTRNPTPVIGKNLNFAPYFNDYILQKSKTILNDEIYSGGFKIHTTLHSQIQAAAQEVIADTNTPYQIALLAMDPKGRVLAMVGGKNYYKSQYNRTLLSRRQPGSTFKPFVYLTALESDCYPEDEIDDVPITLGDGYTPVNYDKKCYGRVTLHFALSHSLNVTAVRLTDFLGPERVVETAQRLGIQSPLMAVPSLPLGSNEVGMMEMTRAFTVFANGGKRVAPVMMTRIEAADGQVVSQNYAQLDEVVSSDIIDMLTGMLEGVVTGGTGVNAGIPDVQVAGKTGTTSDYRDAWFIGYIPGKITCAVWIGRDDNQPMLAKLTGGSLPATVWRRFMVRALPYLK